MTISHVLVTRFNLPSLGAESYIRAQDGWLRERVELFERFTVPSVRAQEKQVRWIVYVDPESPSWLRNRLNAFVDEDLFVVMDAQEVPKTRLIVDVTSVLPSGCTRVVTTNVDNDDALAKDFAARVQEAARAPGTAAIYLDHGLVIAASEAYKRNDRSNAFCSAVSDLPMTVTCWEDWHNRLHLYMPVRHVCGDPGWLQVVHGRNVSNRVRGSLVDPRAYDDQFPGLLCGLPRPGRRQLLTDRLVLKPARDCRDGLRGALRSMAVATLGKDRVNRYKELAAGWRT